MPNNNQVPQKILTQLFAGPVKLKESRQLSSEGTNLHQVSQHPDKKHNLPDSIPYMITCRRTVAQGEPTWRGLGQYSPLLTTRSRISPLSVEEGVAIARVKVSAEESPSTLEKNNITVTSSLLKWIAQGIIQHRRKVVHLGPDSLELSVEEVSPILADANAMLINIVVAIAAQVVALVNDERRHAKLICTPFSNHSARKPSTNYKKINFLWTSKEIQPALT